MSVFVLSYWKEGAKLISISWYLIFTVSIPESLLMVLIGFQLYNLEVRFRNALAIATISALTSYFVRKLPIFFGLHSLIGIIVLFILCWFFTRYPFKKVLYSVLTGFAVMAVTQTVLLPICLALTPFDHQTIKLYPGVESLIFLVQAIAVGIAYVYFKQNRIYIFDLSDGEEDAK